MVSIILFVSSCVVLLLAGFLLARSHKKEKLEHSKPATNHNIMQPHIISPEKREYIFVTKYDELSFLYQNGMIKEEEYRNQIKNIVN